VKKNSYDNIAKQIDIQDFLDSVEESFQDIEDPRLKRNQEFSLSQLLLIILCATIAGANSITAIRQYTHFKLDMFKKLLGISHAPCYMVFWWLLTRLHPKPLQKAFFNWVSKLPKEFIEKCIAIDGKHLNGLIGDNRCHLVA